MNGFSGMITGFLIAGLFVFALLIGGIQLSANLEGSQSIENEPLINKAVGNLSDTLAEAYNYANDTETAVSKSETTITQGTVFLDAMAGVWKTMKVIPIAVYNILTAFVESTLITGPYSYIILGVIGAIIILLFVLYAWKIIRTGDPQ